MNINLRILQMALELWGSFFTLSCAITVLLGRKSSPRQDTLLSTLLFMNTILLISDAIAWAFRGNPTKTGYYAVRISNFLVFALIPVMLVFVAMYIRVLIEQNKAVLHSNWMKAIFLVSGLHVFLLILSVFTGFVYYFDQNNLYHRAAGYSWITILAIIDLILLTALIATHYDHIDKYVRGSLLLYIFLPLGCSIIQMFHYGLSLNNIAATISLLLLFLTNQLKTSHRLYLEQQQNYQHEMALKDKELQLSQRDTELAQTRLQLSLSQMQPHFVFNALGSIEQLCRIDANKAARATHYFAKYIRSNLRAINLADIQSFTDELSHTRSYIWLEKMRYGDDLNYSEDIETGDFMLPVLTIQPLIEHAISQGIMSFDEGILSIHIHAGENSDYYTITLFDDGKSFASEISKKEEFITTTLYTIRERLRLLCDGNIVMDTLPGKGTCFTITIPKK